MDFSLVPRTPGLYNSFMLRTPVQLCDGGRVAVCGARSRTDGDMRRTEGKPGLSPRVRYSVIITCHNQVDFIQDAVDSAVSQPTAQKEIIVIDDASIDGSQQVLKQYGDAIRISLLRQNLGTVGARNQGASLAKGDYLVFLDGDDALAPWALAVYDRIIDLKQPTLILGGLQFFSGLLRSAKASDPGRQIEIVEYEGSIRKDRMYRASASSIVVEREKFQAVNGWSAGMFPIEDIDLVAKLGHAGPAVMVMSPRTAFYRIHASNAFHEVKPFMGLVQKIIRKARMGQYPGGYMHRHELYAFVGGPIAHWARRACTAGLYRDALELLLNGSAMILAAVVQRSASKIIGQRPVEVIGFYP
jgi:glycosyltransferase involved in cell wall biosynthesis